MDMGSDQIDSFAIAGELSKPQGTPQKSIVGTIINAVPPAYSEADYLTALQSLLPTGRVWPRDPNSTQVSVLSGLVPSIARHNVAANNLLIDAFPATTYQLLAEWEATLGLPDPCAGEYPNLLTRRSQVLARFCGVGGQSISYIIAYASALGFPITITQYAPARIGACRVGQPVNSQDWAFAWTVNAGVTNVQKSHIGYSYAGQPIQSFGNEILECAIKEIAPAHTIVNFSYKTS
ncbi:YmfQ family protein [Undibacterium sp. MH2W]|uniref:YmfQ family protein n=1 Tax=Undibacterium sp. MH2W TaxID=3413044 RepID=UPI003BF3D900